MNTNNIIESRRSGQIIRIEPEACILCYACVRECPAMAIEVKANVDHVSILPNRCIACGSCTSEKEPPVGAFVTMRGNSPACPYIHHHSQRALLGRLGSLGCQQLHLVQAQPVTSARRAEVELHAIPTGAEIRRIAQPQRPSIRADEFAREIQKIALLTKILHV